jgi:hypothetical protein
VQYVIVCTISPEKVWIKVLNKDSIFKIFPPTGSVQKAALPPLNINYKNAMIAHKKISMANVTKFFNSFSI